MTALDRDLVRRKLRVITRNIRDMARVARLSLEEYRADRLRQKGVERLLQETVEAAADINVHILRCAGHAAPADYFTSFVEMGTEGAIPQDLANSLAPSAGLRNRIVHEYDAIDDAIVLRAAGTAAHQFAAYVAAVESYLGSAK